MPKSIVKSVPKVRFRVDKLWCVLWIHRKPHFIPYLKKENISKPVIFFVDVPSYSTSKSTINDHGIVLISLFPNSTQPADVAVFKSLKSG